MSPPPDDQRKQFTCKQCGEVFVSEEAQQEHLESCFQCEICKQIFRKQYLVTTHMIGCMTGNGEATFTHRDSVDTDMTSHTSEKASSGESGDHIEDNSNLPDDKQERNKTDEYKQCEEAVNESAQIEPDLRKQDLSNTSKCGKHLGNDNLLQINSGVDIANEYFTEDLTSDMRRYSSDAPFKCNVKNKHSLDEHMDLHTGEKPYHYSQCEQGFTKNDQLTNHMRRHSPEKLYTCVKCGKNFSRELNMSIDMKLYIECLECEKQLAHNGYMRGHTGEKAHVGDICRRSFNSTDYLTKHIAFCTEEKLYECSVCGKCFKNNWGLNRHMKTHTGEKTHKCDVCNKHFTESCNLAQHMRIHTGEKPYKCNECGKCFRNSSNFTEHKRTHTGEKPYSCPVCGKAFRQHHSYAYHMKKHHGE